MVTTKEQSNGTLRDAKLSEKEGIIMDRNVSYEISLRKENRQDCLTLLYGNEDTKRHEESFLREENLPDEAEVRTFYGGLALLFVASLAIVVFLLL
jgi:hypothetical protein